jgi:hypothetical protein
MTIVWLSGRIPTHAARFRWKRSFEGQYREADPAVMKDWLTR